MVAQVGVGQLQRRHLLLRRGPRPHVRRHGVAPQAELHEDVRGHVQRVLGVGRDLRVAPRRLEPARRERRVVAGVNQVVRAAGMIRVRGEHPLREVDGGIAGRLLLGRREVADVGREHRGERGERRRHPGRPDTRGPRHAWRPRTRAPAPAGCRRRTALRSPLRTRAPAACRLSPAARRARRPAVRARGGRRRRRPRPTADGCRSAPRPRTPSRTPDRRSAPRGTPRPPGRTRSCGGTRGRAGRPVAPRRRRSWRTTPRRGRRPRPLRDACGAPDRDHAPPAASTRSAAGLRRPWSCLRFIAAPGRSTAGLRRPDTHRGDR